MTRPYGPRNWQRIRIFANEIIMTRTRKRRIGTVVLNKNTVERRGNQTLLLAEMGNATRCNVQRMQLSACSRCLLQRTASLQDFLPILGAPQPTVGRNPFLAGQNSKNSKLKNIKIMKVRVFSIEWYTFLQEGASPAVCGNVVNT